MARKLEDWPTTTHTGPAPKYPWDEWMDGSVWEVTRGVDFPDSTAQSFRSFLHAKAREKDLTVRTSVIDDDTVVFRFSKANGNDIPEQRKAS